MPNTGKSTIVNHWENNEYDPSLERTIGLYSRHITYKGFDIEFLDFGGAKEFREKLWPDGKTNIDGIVYVFDFFDIKDDEDSLRVFREFIIDDRKIREIPKIILASKIDLRTEMNNNRFDTLWNQIINLSRDSNCEFFEVSALTSENINESLDSLIDRINSRTS